MAMGLLRRMLSAKVSETLVRLVGRVTGRPRGEGERVNSWRGRMGQWDCYIFGRRMRETNMRGDGCLREELGD